MKKIYQTPETDVVYVEGQQLLDASKLDVYNDDTEGISNNEEVLSRRHKSIWDIDDEY